MTAARKSIVFLILTLTIGLSGIAMAWQQGMRDMLTTANPPPVFQLSMLAPAIAAVICTIAFERGQRLKALGLRLVPNWWWLAALVMPVGLGAVYIAVNLIADGRNLFEPDRWAQALSAMERSDINGKFPNLAVAVIVMTLVNTLTEELGWRGYLHHLWRRFGFVQAALGAGFAQGVWHWPLVLLFGIGFTGNALIDLALYPIINMVLGVYHTLFREHGRSVLAAGIFHGAFNVVASNSAGAGSYAVMALLVLGAVAIVRFHRLSLKNPRSSPADSASPIPE